MAGARGGAVALGQRGRDDVTVYKVLATRGMVGTVIYSTDAETQALLETLIQSAETSDP